MQSSFPAPSSASPSRRRHPLEAISLAGHHFDGDGAAAAPLVWLYLCSLARSRREVWPANATISRATGLSLRSVRYGLAQLEAESLVRSRWGRRLGWRKCGRILTLALSGPAPRMRWPEPGEIRVVWSLCRDQRERPVALATLAIAMILASGGDSCAVLRVSQTLIQGLTGSRAGGSFTSRLAELTELGVIERAGACWSDGVRVGARMFEVELERSVGERSVNLQSVGPRPELPVSRMLRCSAPIQDYDDLELEGHETQVIGWGPPRLASAG